MTTDKLFDTTINLAARSLDLRSRRHDLILSNIANADTPGYKSFDIYVDEALAKQLPQQEPQVLQRTHPGHLSQEGQPGSPIKPMAVPVSAQVTLRGDGNTVDMDREMANLAANQLQYRSSAQVLANKFKGLMTVIKGGGN